MIDMRNCLRRGVASATGWVLLPLLLAGCTRAPEEKLSFNESIQPILSENCYACHGPDSGSRKAELRLDHAQFAYQPHGKFGPAIVPGKPDKSPLANLGELHTWDEFLEPDAPIYTLGRGPSLGSALQGALLFNENSEGTGRWHGGSFVSPWADRGGRPALQGSDLCVGIPELESAARWSSMADLMPARMVTRFPSQAGRRS